MGQVVTAAVMVAVTVAAVMALAETVVAEMAAAWVAMAAVMEAVDTLYVAMYICYCKSTRHQYSYYHHTTVVQEFGIKYWLLSMFYELVR